MKKILFFIIICFLVICCSKKKEEQQEKSFYDEAKLRLEKVTSIQVPEGNIQDLDTIFTAKIIGTDSVFLVGYKFVIVTNKQKELKYEYLYQNLHNKKKELLISTLTDKSIEEGAKEAHKKAGGNYRDALFVYAATFLSIKGTDIE